MCICSRRPIDFFSQRMRRISVDSRVGCGTRFRLESGDLHLGHGRHMLSRDVV